MELSNMFQNTFKTANALLYTIRPSATLGSCLLVLAAFNPTNNELDTSVALMVCTFFGAAFCFLVNDIYDREKDLLNDKQRPVATGVIPLKTAIWVAVWFALIFVVSAYFLGIIPFLLSFVFLGFTYGYSYINARSGLFANIIVAFIVSGTQWGVALIKPDHRLIWTSLFLFFLTVPRELLLDWLDKGGDHKIGKKSSPINYSTRINRIIVVVTLLAATYCLASLFYSSSLDSLFTLLLPFTMVSIWASFAPFLIRADDFNALLSIRLSHSTFVLFIIAMLLR